MTFLNFLSASSQKDSSDFYKNRPLISSPTTITPELAKELLKFVNPVTLSSTYLQGRTVQLWHHKSELIASVVQGDKITLIPGDRVCNALQPNEKDKKLLKRLQTSGLRKWQFAYLTEKNQIEAA